jgi:uncharacterized protein YndB with AHSA1/START domain
MPARTTRRLFSRETEVETDIHASPAAVWAILTDGTRFSEWTSTVLSIEGTIGPGERIRLRSSLDPKRTFKLTVREFAPPSTLAWGDAMGTRTYSLAPKPNGIVRFRMHEKIGGPLFPLFARMIPSFDASFEQFAHDLKRRAESTSGGAHP